MARKRLLVRGIALLATGVLVATSVAVSGPAAAAPTRFEAENATIFHGLVESNHLNFSGTGFVNSDNEIGSYVEWTVTASITGTATIALRYANGTTTNRPM